MMRLLGSLLASSKPLSKQPLHGLERSLAAYLLTTNHSYEPRFFSAWPSAIPQEFNAKEKSTNGIRLMSIQHVKPDKPTPHYLQSYKLSALDQINAPSYVPFVFFYANSANKNTLNIDNLVFERSKLLKDSLSKTLTRFYPIAGKYINDNHIECNDEGVYYVETRIDADLSSFITKPDYKLLQCLIPMPPNFKNPTRGYYLSMIQVNFFNCGGVGISMSNSHKLIDGSTYMTFLNAWASATKGDNQQKIVPPSFIASSLFIPNAKTPTYPSFPLSSLAIWPLMLRRGKCSTKRFRFNASALQSLKTKTSISSTRVVAVTSLIWKCATTAARKLRGVDRQSILQIAVNIRGRLTPPLPRNAIGNIIWNAVAKCDANERLSLDTMVGFVKDGIGKIDTRFVEKFKGEKGSDNVIDEIQKLGSQMSSYEADYYSSSSLCNSGIYDADFGWGRPVWCCLGYLNNDVPLYANVILLMDTRNGDGVEAWVTLSEEEMEIVECDPELLLYASVEPSPLQG